MASGSKAANPEAEASHRRSGHFSRSTHSFALPLEGRSAGWMPTTRALSTHCVNGRSPSCEMVKIKSAWKAHPTPPLSRHTVVQTFPSQFDHNDTVQVLQPKIEENEELSPEDLHSSITLGLALEPRSRTKRGVATQSDRPNAFVTLASE